jgi:hypothetical protein
MALRRAAFFEMAGQLNLHHHCKRTVVNWRMIAIFVLVNMVQHGSAAATVIGVILLVKRTAKGVAYGYHHASHHYNRPSGAWRRMVRPRTLVLNGVDRKLPWRLSNRPGWFQPWLPLRAS